MELQLITWQACNKCHFIQPKLEELAAKKGWHLVVTDAWEYKWEHLGDITSLPTMIKYEDLVEARVMDYDAILQFYMDNNN